MSITRSEVLRRAGLWPLGSVPYSQSTLRGDGYRQDCSGFVSMAGNVPPNGPGCWGGFNTVTAVSEGYIHEIDPNDLRPADLIGKCGPGTAGDDGHIQIFVGWDNNVDSDNGHTVLEQTGGSAGPHRRHYATWTDGYKAYRFRDIIEDAPAPTPVPVHQAPPFPLPRNEYFGLITGPKQSHGGYYATERPWVKLIQQTLIRKGYVPGITDPSNSWADGIFEQPTADAVARFQRAEMPGTQYYGQVWWDDWARLCG